MVLTGLPPGRHSWEQLRRSGNPARRGKLRPRIPTSPMQIFPSQLGPAGRRSPPRRGAGTRSTRSEVIDLHQSSCRCARTTAEVLGYFQECQRGLQRVLLWGYRWGCRLTSTCQEVCTAIPAHVLQERTCQKSLNKGHWRGAGLCIRYLNCLELDSDLWNSCANDGLIQGHEKHPHEKTR